MNLFSKFNFFFLQPRREEDRIDHKKYKDVKEKMRRQKERARLKEHVDKLRKHRRPNKSKNHSRHPIKPQDPPNLDITAAAERKIKDTFRINMANVMVHFLNPYRKNDCKQGRITNTEDFKHLARKVKKNLFFFILLFSKIYIFEP